MFREMRRNKQQMSREAAEALLISATSGVLSLLGDDGYPYGVPMSFAYENGKLYFHSALSGHKIDAIQKEENQNGAKASFTAVLQDDIVPEKYTTLYRSVIAFGRMYIAASEEERSHGLQLLHAKYNPAGTEADLQKELTASPKLHVLVMDLDHITGKASRELVE